MQTDIFQKTTTTKKDNKKNQGRVGKKGLAI